MLFLEASWGKSVILSWTKLYILYPNNTVIVVVVILGAYFVSSMSNEYQYTR